MFTSNDIMNIKYGIDKEFGSRERSYYIRVNDYFCRRQNNISHSIPNYGPGKSNFVIDSCRQTYFSPEKVSQIRKPGKIRLKINVFF